MSYASFFGISPNVTLWQILDSQFLTTLLAAVFGVFLLRYESRLNKAEERAEKAQESAQDAADIVKYQAEAQEKEQELELELEEAAPEAVPIAPNVIDFRQQANAVIEQAKRYLEKRVVADNDRRHKRTYEKIPRYDYNVLAIALHERGQISDEELSDAMRIFAEWRKYSKGRAANKVVPEPVYTSIQNAYARLNSAG